MNPSQRGSGERVLPLGPAELSELHGSAWAWAMGSGPAGDGSKEQRRPLRLGDRVPHGQRIETAHGDDSRVELRFADGSLLRLGQGTLVSLLLDTRQVFLHRGRLLVSGDRMLGSITVLGRWLSFVPQGTTYIVEHVPAQPPAEPQLELTVMEGAVCVCPTAGAGKKAAARPAKPTPDMIILPGERLLMRPPQPLQHPQPDSLTARMKDEPLLSGFVRPLPTPTMLRLDELADQQRRHMLAGRNERLRREIFWKRPPLPPIELPGIFGDPDSVTVRWEYPQ